MTTIGRQGTPPPPSENENPYIAPGPGPIVFDTFKGLNTKASRPGIDDDEMSWCDGFMPIGKNNLRTMYGVGVALYAASPGLMVVFFDFANIGPTPICVVLLSDGSLQQVNTNTKVVTQMAPPGTITNPALNSVAMTQWGSQYVILVAKQTNGYWLWDGTIFYRAGSIGPQIVVTAGGSGYTGGATAAITGGSGTGATASVQVTNGIVTGLTVTNSGTGYVVGDTVAVAITGVSGGSGATATLVIMPFGISGNAVETYQSRVWIANVAVITFSAPSSVIDFSTTNGGGSFTSNDSFLRVTFTQLKQTNGFLYLIADSSENYISGVQTSGVPLTTTFTNQNADPELGTPYAPTVDVFSRNILFANAIGAHVSYGGAVTKISDALDGVYNSVPNFAGIVLSACKAIVFGVKVWALLVPVVDTVTNQQVNKLFLWDGKKWWSTPQDVTLVYVQHQEINSVLTAYGTDGTTIYPLFNQPSVAFTKTVQSKLFDKPGGLLTNKGVSRLWGMANYYSNAAPDLTVSVDNENGVSNQVLTLGPQVVPVFNNVNALVPIFNNVNDEIEVLGSGNGVVVFPPQAVAQQGVLIGLTAKTNAADMALITLAIDDNIVGYRG